MDLFEKFILSLEKLDILRIYNNFNEILKSIKLNEINCELDEKLKKQKEIFKLLENIYAAMENNIDITNIKENTEKLKEFIKINEIIIINN